MFNLKHNFSDCVTAEDAFFNNNMMSADEKLMTVISNLKQLLTVKYMCKLKNKACFKLNL